MWLNEKSKAYPAKALGDGTKVAEALWTDYLSANGADTTVLNDESLAVGTGKLTKASSAEATYTWLAVNQNTAWNKKMEMTYVDAIKVSTANQAQVDSVKTGKRSFAARQYLSYTLIEG